MPSKKLLLASAILFVLVTLPLIGSVGASLELWSQTYGGVSSDAAEALVQTSDGGYALAGYTTSFGAGSYDFWLVKTDANGNMEWNQTYGGAGIEHACALVGTSDGGFALLGTASFGAGKRDFWLVKTDEFGNMKWNQTYGGADYDDPSSLVRTSDGGYAIAGWTTSFGAEGDDFWLVKIDAYGNVEWSQTYGRGRSDRARALVATSDGGYALAGETISNGYGDRPHWDFWLVKTDANGDMEWNRTYGKGAGENANALVETSDGGYAIAGDTSILNPEIGIVSDFWLVKTDKYGNMEWNKTYSGWRAYALVETSDRKYALAGGSRLVKTDAYGVMEWNRTYEGVAYALVETSDGGYAIAGYVPIDAGTYDFWLAKTDERGFIPEFHPPYIRVDSPKNITYTTDNVLLNFTVNEETSWMGYSLDDQNNVTLTEKTLTLTGLTDGLHNMTVYATDTDGNTATSETIHFIIKATPTKGIAAIAIAAVATAAAAIIIYYTRTKKNRTKNENILGS
jgi:hypothetical protein